MRWSAVLVAAALAPYLSGFRGSFSFDDHVAIEGNPDVVAQSPGVPWGALWRHDFWGNDIMSKHTHKSFRPLTVLSFRLGFLAHGNSAPMYRLGNVALHAVCTLLVVPFAERVMRVSPSGAWWAALLFAVHPAHAESVTSLVGRADDETVHPLLNADPACWNECRFDWESGRRVVTVP